MCARTLLPSCGFILVFVAVTVHAASPDDPGAPVAPTRYAPVISGSKSYRPVEPLSWGDINRRVMPPAERTGDGQAPSTAPKQNESPLPQSGPQHKH